MTDFSKMTACAATLLVASAALLTACGGDDKLTPDTPDWGVADYNIQMRVVSEDGQNLLNSKTVGNIVRSGVKAEYGGRTYGLDTIATEKPHPDTPEAKVSFTGLTRYAPVGTTNYLMLFGDFDGSAALADRDIIIDWNDGGKKDTVTFTHTCERSGDKVTTRTDVQLNHKPAQMPVTFVRP